MNRPRRFRSGLALTLAAALLLGVAGTVLAQASGLTLVQWTLDSGGGTSQASGYVLAGTAGQADAGSLAGGVYQLDGGFWGGGAQGNIPDTTWIYLPVVVH